MSLNKILASVFVLCCAVHSGMFKELPDYIKVCKWDQDTINDCARHSIEELRPTLKMGIPELNVPGIEPFIIKELIPSIGDSSLFKAVGRDVKVTGAGNFTLKHLDVDLDTFTVKARVRFPKLRFDGKFEINAPAFVVPISGESGLTAEAIKCDADLVLNAKIVEKDGVKYITFTKLTMDINMKDYRLKLEGLFNGDKVLGEAANQAINQNRAELMRNAKPVIEKTVSILLLDLANKIISDLSLDQLFPKP